MYKKFLLLLLLALLLPATVAAYNFTVDGIYYNKNGNEATVTYRTTSYNSYSGSVTIPSTVTYDGVTYTVTAIGDNAFNKSTGLTSVTIPISMTSIGNNAFQGCSGLTSVTIPSSVMTIGDYAFQGCSGLTSVTIPNSITSISNYAFQSCSRLTSVIIPNSVTSIGTYAFSGCSGLTSLTIPNSVTTIGNYAFNSCSGIASVSIPNSVTTLGDHAFTNCRGLTSITIPNSITAICDYVFSGCSGLSAVSIPNSVTTIGQCAFQQCTGLTSVSIPNSVTDLGNSAFYGCTGLESIDFGNSIKTIGNSSFYHCTGLTSVIIPNSVITIGQAAFLSCSGLTSVNLGNSIETLGKNVFRCCGLTKVTIPNSITGIGHGAFSDCTNLKILNFNAVNCANFTNSSNSSTGDYNTFNNCPLETIIIGDEVTRIPNYLTVSTKKNYLTTLIIGKSVTSIGVSAFQSCTGLTSLTLPNSISTIESNAFASCSNLKTIYISGEGEWKAGALPMNSSIKTLYIGSGITLLSNMQVNPTDIYCYAAVPPTCHANAFTGYTGKLHVPSSSYATYCFALTWENFTDIEAGAVEPQTIRLNKTSLEMMPYDEVTLTATLQPSGAYPNSPILWWSTDPNVATVVNGVVTAVSPGECDIIASCFPVRSECHVVVESTSGHIVITLDQHEAQVKVNHMINLIPTMTPEETDLEVTSSDPTVAGARVVNGSIRVVGIHVGETTITVSSADGTAQSDACLVTVFTDPGDVNCDGSISISDVTALINVLLSSGGGDNPYADVNGDGRISIADVTSLINLLLTGN